MEPNTSVLSISSNSSICSDFCGFNQELKEKNEADKRYFASEVNLLPAEEVFEVNSNSTPDTLKRERLERNKDLRLKETYLVSRSSGKKPPTGIIYPKARVEEHSESSSEFPASSPSNTQFQNRPQQSQRMPLLKNTLPADAFERSLALIVAQNPPLSINEKINSWRCANIDDLSDIEDVKNFDASFKAQEAKLKRLPPRRARNAIPGELSTSTYAEFYRRLLNIRAPKPNLLGNDYKQNNKFTSEDDEKPTGPSANARNRDTPLKKRPTKYKRAADPHNDLNIPKKKSSSSETPKNEKQTNSQTKTQQHQQEELLAATAAGNDEMQLYASCSNASSHASSLKNLRSIKSKQTQIIESTSISSNLRNKIGLATMPTKEDQEAFFRWRRLSREIDKTNNLKLLASSPPKPSTGLIQIRYDFTNPKTQSTEEKEEKNKSNSYNVVMKTLKIEQMDTDENNEKIIFKTPLETQKFKEIKTKSITTAKETRNDQQNILLSNKESEGKTENMVQELKPFTNSNINHNNNNNNNHILELKTLNKNTNNKFIEDPSVEFHQQHEFCNYLGLTGMSTANAMATAAAELSKCNIARRSLRVRQIEQLKAKDSKSKMKQRKKENDATKSHCQSSNDERSNDIDVKGQEKPSIDLSKTMENSLPTICAENNEKMKSISSPMNNELCSSKLTPSEQLMQQKKEREAKIQILCQITASSKEEEEEACKKCVEQITEPIRRTLLEQFKQSGDGPKTSPIKSLIKLDKNAQQQQRNLLAEIPNAAEKDDQATKILELTSKIAGNITTDIDNEKAEIQTLHQKVQKCLEEARQNPPNIFIVKSLNSLEVENEKEDDVDIEDKPTKKAKIKETTCVKQLSDDEEGDDEENEEMEEKAELPLLGLRSKSSIKNHKGTQANATAASTTVKDNNKNKKRKPRTAIRKSNSNLSGTRRLYTRSMLNLNQQRELRNRKVILKLLKTYSGLRIKVSQAKKKSTNKTTEESSINGNKKKKRNVSHYHQQQLDEDNEASIELAVSSEDVVGDTKPAPVTTLFINKLSESSSTNVIETSSTSVEDQHVVGTTQNDNRPTTRKDNATLCETKAVFEYENLFNGDSENGAAATSSRTLTPKHIRFSEATEPANADSVKQMNLKENATDAAVQTDLANVKTVLQPLVLNVDMNSATGDAVACSTAPPPPTSVNDANDVVSSSDIVTSTTCHIGVENRNARHNLVTKELYRNFSFTAESNLADNAVPSDISAASNIYNEMNPLANVSLNSSAANINDLGIHALSEPSRALRNPLKMSDGPVLYMYYEDGLLIVVQETLVSFWKYMRILNALTVKPHETKCTNSLNSRDVGTEELQSSAATLDFRSSDLEHMSSMLVSGCEWFYLGERKRLSNDIEIESPYMNRLCFNDSRPVYVEMRCRELLNDFRECNLLSCYVNVYFFNEEEQVPCFHSIQLDSIQSAPIDVIYTTIFDSRYFVLAWPQANVLGKVRSGVCKYALTPELDMLATTRDFKAMRHAIRSLECLKDGKLLGFGDSQLTVWDHRSGDVLMNYDLSMPLGRNLGTIYFQGVETGQDNVVIMLQHVRSEASSDLVVIACTISHLSPSRRVLQRHRLPTPAFYNIRRAVNNGEHFVITSNSDEEIWINCNDPRQLIFIPAQRSQRFYSTNRSTLVELTNQTLTVDSFSNYLLKIAAGINSGKNKTLQSVATSPRSWCLKESF